MKKLSKIVSDVESAKTHGEQVQKLRNSDSKSLREILTFSMHPHVQWLVPETDPPYKPLAADLDVEGKMHTEVKMFKYFTNTAVGNELKQIRREQMFITLLESLDPDDAKLLLRMRNKALKIPREAVDEAMPDLTVNWPKQ